MIKNKISNTIILMLILVLIFSSFITAQANEQDKQIDVLRLAGGDSGFPSPFAHSIRGGGKRSTLNIYDSLLVRGEDGLLPWLAEDYEVKNGGKQYLFTIREDVKWHDSEPLTAEDVKFTFEYTAKHPLVRNYVTPEEIEEIEIIGGDKVLITVSEPKVTNLYNLGMTYVIPKHIWEGIENPKEYLEDDALTGSGPYKLAEYNRAHETYEYEAFSEFWGPIPAFKKIQREPVSEETLAFERGEIDYYRHVSPDMLKRYRNNPEYKVLNAKCFDGSRLFFNMKDYPIFRQKKLRQAFMYALNSKEFIEKIARGEGVPTNAGILPPDHPMYNPYVRQYGYEPEKARKLLDELGYKQSSPDEMRKGKDGKKLSFTVLTGEKRYKNAELIKEQLSRVGIGINVEAYDGRKYDELIVNNKYQLAVYGHAGLGENADYLRKRYASARGDDTEDLGSTGYHNEEVEKLLRKQQIEFDGEKRKELLFKIQEILAEDVPEIMLYYGVKHGVYRPDKYDGYLLAFDDGRCPLNSKLTYVLKD